MQKNVSSICSGVTCLNPITFLVLAAFLRFLLVFFIMCDILALCAPHFFFVSLVFLCGLPTEFYPFYDFWQRQSGYTFYLFGAIEIQVDSNAHKQQDIEGGGPVFP